MSLIMEAWRERGYAPPGSERMLASPPGVPSQATGTELSMGNAQGLSQGGGTGLRFGGRRAGDAGGEGGSASSPVVPMPTPMPVPVQTPVPASAPFDDGYSPQAKASVRSELARETGGDGWVGKPVDVVQMPDGTLASIDNTRILAARMAGIKYQGNVRGFDEPINDLVRQASLVENGITPKTWGEAAQLRISKPTQNQAYPEWSPGWAQRFPNGSVYDPLVKKK